jgi:WD40 repeat protein
MEEISWNLYLHTINYVTIAAEEVINGHTSANVILLCTLRSKNMTGLGMTINATRVFSSHDLPLVSRDREWLLGKISCVTVKYSDERLGRVNLACGCHEWVLNQSVIKYRHVVLHSKTPTGPFNITHPTAVQTSLFASALFARFDPTGRYVGTGRNNGAAAIWDLETRAPIRWLEGHVKAVTSLEYVCVLNV